MPSIFDPDLCKIRHEQNRIFIHVERHITYYNKNNPRVPFISRPPRVKVTFIVSHQLVHDNIPRPSYDDGVKLHVNTQIFRQPLRVLASPEDSGPTFEAMISRLQIPFQLRSEFGPIVWGFGYDEDGVLIHDAAADLSKVAQRIVRDVAEDAASERRTLKELEIVVDTMKRTVIETEVYRSLQWEYPEDDCQDMLEAAVDDESYDLHKR